MTMRSRLLIIRSVLVSVMLLAIALNPGQGATLSEYQRVLAAAESKLELAVRMERARPGSGEQVLNALQGSIPPSVSVESPAGREIKVDLFWLKTNLHSLLRSSGKKRADNAEKLLSRVQTLRAAAEGMPRNESAYLQHARSTLQDILKRSEYKVSWLERVSQRVFAAIVDLVTGLLERIAPRAASRIVGWVVISLLALAFAAAMVRVVLYLIRRYARGPDARRQVERVRSTKQARPSLESLIGNAEREASEGRYREAFRCIYLAAILLLDRARLITYCESATNWEYMRAMKCEAPPETSEVFTGMTAVFDELIYGQRSVSGDDYCTSVRQFRRLEAMV